MWLQVDFEKPATLGELRKVINNDLSKFPDETPINMCIDIYRYNVEDAEEQPCAPILSLLGDNESINFYNYI